jgi:translocation and assembly module TamB
MRWLRRILIGSLITCLVLVALGIGAIVYLGSTRARTQVAAQLQETLGLPARVDELSVGLSTTSLRVQFYEPGKNHENSEPLATIEDAQADLPLLDLIRGKTMPLRLTLRSAKVAIRLDKNGRLLTKLPEAEGGLKKLPAILVENGQLVVQQEGHADFLVQGIAGDLQTDGNQVALSGTVHDSAWGDWTLKGQFDRQTNQGAANLSTLRFHATPDLLTRLPCVPDGVWEQIQAEGDASVRFAVWSIPTDPKVHYEATLETQAGKLHIAPIQLDASQVRGKIVIKDDVIRVENAQAQAADGTLKVDGTLDIGQSPSVLDIHVRAQSLEVQRLPKSWSLPSEIAGRLKGSANLKVVLADGGVQVSGTGKGLIENASVAGLPAEPVELRLDSDGKRFRFSPQQTSKDDNRSQKDLASSFKPFFTIAAALLALPLEARQPAKPAEKPTYFEAKISLKDVDIKQLADKAHVTLPFSVAGSISVQIMLAIPINQARAVKAYRFEGSAESPRLVVEGVELKDLKTRAVYRDGLLSLQELSGLAPPADQGNGAKTGDGSFHGSAQMGVDPQKDLTAKLELKDIPLAQLAKVLPNAGSGTSGRFSGSAALRGPIATIRDIDTWEASGSLSSDELHLYERRLQNVRLDMRMERGTFALSKVDAKVEGIALSGDASLRLAGPFAFEAGANVGRTDVVALQRLIPEWKQPIPIEAALQAKAQLKGTLKPLTWSASGSAKANDLRIAKAKAEGLSFAWKATPDHLQIDDLKADLFDGTIKGTADLPLRPTAAGKVKISLQNVDLKDLAKALPDFPVHLAGQVNGKLEGDLPAVKKGEAREVNADLELKAPQLRIQDIPAERLRGTVHYRNGKVEYSLDGDTLGGQLHIDGKVPQSGEAPKKPGEEPDGHLSLQSVQLRRLADDLRQTRLRKLRGTIDLKATYSHLAGDRAPTGTGQFVLTGLGWGANDWADRIRGELRLENGEVQLNNLNGAMADGRLNGRMVWNLLQPRRRFMVTALDNAELSKLLAPFPDLAGKIQGPASIRLRGTLGLISTGTGEIASARFKAGGVTITEGRLPLDWTIAPTRGYGMLSIRDATAQAARGRLLGQAKANWGTSNHLEGQLRFLGVQIRTLLSEAADITQIASGLMDASFTFKGDDVQSINDVGGTLTAKLTQTQGLQLPVFRQAASLVGLGSSITTVQNGDLAATLGGGILAIQRLGLTNSTLQLFAQGSVSLQGKLSLDVLVNTGRLGVNPGFLRLFGLRVPVTGPIPVGLLLEAGSYLSNRVIDLTVTGTLRSPNMQVKPLRILTQEATRFFLGQANVPIP